MKSGYMKQEKEKHGTMCLNQSNRNKKWWV